MLPCFWPESLFSTSLNPRWLFLAALVASLVGCSSKNELVSDAETRSIETTAPVQDIKLEGRIFGTRWMLKARGAQVDQTQLLPLIEAEFEAINQGMSTWRKDSDISKFNAGDAGAYRFGDQSVEVIKRSLQVARQTQGAFDPTVAPLIRLWGFGAKALKEPPTPSLLRAARQVVGYSKLAWNAQGELVKNQPG